MRGFPDLSHIKLGHPLHKYIWGRNGFDGDFEVFGASRGGSHDKIPNF